MEHAHISNKTVGSPYNQMIFVPPTRGVMPYYAIPHTPSSPLTLSLSRAQSIVQKLKQSKKGTCMSAPNTPVPELDLSKRDSSDMEIEEDHKENIEPNLNTQKCDASLNKDAMQRKVDGLLQTEHELRCELELERNQLQQLKERMRDQEALHAGKMNKMTEKLQEFEFEYGIQIKHFTEQIKLKDDLICSKDEQIQEIKAQIESQIQETAAKLTKDLSAKYLEEYTLRKKYFNELQDMRGNIRVYCRVRPILPHEGQSVVEYCAENSLKVKDKIFQYDGVFDPSVDQETVFEEVQPVVISVLDGYNVCMFAYGQTGSGKTYTMVGPEHNPGIQFRAVEELFKSILSRSKQVQYTINLSVLEIYNEQLRDLLNVNNSKKLEIRKNAEGQTYVSDLTAVEVKTAEEALNNIDTAAGNRSVGATDCNQHSSRNLLSGAFSQSKLTLIDLAGSERVSKSMAVGERLKEAQHINKSLSALGNVMNALVSKGPHIPYRDSKLTFILQDSLGGNSKTLVFVQVSPAATHESETLCTLQFGSRARLIELGRAKQNVDMSTTVQQQFVKYKEDISKLRDDLSSRDRIIEDLKSKLSIAQTEKCELLVTLQRERDHKKEAEHPHRQSAMLFLSPGKDIAPSLLKSAPPKLDIIEEQKIDIDDQPQQSEIDAHIQAHPFGAWRDLAKAIVADSPVSSPNPRRSTLTDMKPSVPAMDKENSATAANVASDDNEVVINRAVKVHSHVHFADSPKDKPSVTNGKRKAPEVSDAKSPLRKVVAKSLGVQNITSTTSALTPLSPFQDRPAFSMSLRSSSSSASSISSNSSAKKSKAQRVLVSTPSKTPAKRIRVVQQ